MINSVVLVGRAGDDPAVRAFASGSMLAELSMAVDRQGKDGDRKTDWFSVKLWGKPAEIARDYVRKGHLFGITGELQQETWTGDNGAKRSKIVVIAHKLKLMQPKRADDQPALEDDECPF